MSLVLHIDTSGPEAWVVLAEKGQLLHSISKHRQQDHASFLHPAILQSLKQVNRTVADIKAVAVCTGPGSYTGIRIGMAAAKGLCYAAGIPLITVNSLEVSARALRDADQPDHTSDLPTAYCPMVDARRMEVFTAVYDRSLRILMQPQALILEPHSYVKILLNNRVVFTGSGAEKWQRLCIHANAVFVQECHRDRAMACLSWEKMQCEAFTDLVYTEPMYLKDFFSGSISAEKR